MSKIYLFASIVMVLRSPLALCEVRECDTQSSTNQFIGDKKTILNKATQNNDSQAPRKGYLVEFDHDPRNLALDIDKVPISGKFYKTVKHDYSSFAPSVVKVFFQPLRFEPNGVIESPPYEFKDKNSDAYHIEDMEPYVYKERDRLFFFGDSWSTGLLQIADRGSFQQGQISRSQIEEPLGFAVSGDGTPFTWNENGILELSTSEAGYQLTSSSSREVIETIEPTRVGWIAIVSQPDSQQIRFVERNYGSPVLQKSNSFIVPEDLRGLQKFKLLADGSWLGFGLRKNADKRYENFWTGFKQADPQVPGSVITHNDAFKYSKVLNQTNFSKENEGRGVGVSYNLVHRPSDRMAVFVDENGSIYIAVDGAAGNLPPKTPISLIKLKPDGNLDESFGQGGLLAVPSPDPSIPISRPESLVVSEGRATILLRTRDTFEIAIKNPNYRLWKTGVVNIPLSKQSPPR